MLAEKTRSLSIALCSDLPKYFTFEEMKRVLTPELKEKDYKTYFLILFLWNTGTRISEALSIKIKDVDFASAVLPVRTLKRRDHYRSIPLQTSFLGELVCYINSHGLRRDDPLFPVTRRTAHNWIQSACLRAGLNDERAHAHTFRHSFAVNCISQGVPVVVLKEILGHRDINKTLTYTKILATDYRRFLDAVSFC